MQQRLDAIALEIMPGERVLVFALVRDGQCTPVTLMWKKTVPGSHGEVVHMVTSSGDVPDKDGTHGRGRRIEAPTYQAVKTAFKSWLKSLPKQRRKRAAQSSSR